eukprot:6462401-Amphidinium_carterae.1
MEGDLEPLSKIAKNPPGGSIRRRPEGSADRTLSESHLRNVDSIVVIMFVICMAAGESFEENLSSCAAAPPVSYHRPQLLWQPVLSSGLVEAVSSALTKSTLVG